VDKRRKRTICKIITKKKNKKQNTPLHIHNCQWSEQELNQSIAQSLNKEKTDQFLTPLHRHFQVLRLFPVCKHALK